MQDIQIHETNSHSHTCIFGWLITQEHSIGDKGFPPAIQTTHATILRKEKH